MALVLQLCGAIDLRAPAAAGAPRPEAQQCARDAQGQVKLLDFSGAKALGRRRPARPASPTPTTASPEQVRGRPWAATDLYSLGVLTYQLLTGVCPTGIRPPPQEAAARSMPKTTPTAPAA